MMLAGEFHQHRFYTIPSIAQQLFGEQAELFPSVDELFELEIAHLEYATFDRRQLLRRSAFFQRIDGEDTAHFCLCARQSQALSENRSAQTRSYFENGQFSTGYATHSLFPYRGKFHPQLIKKYEKHIFALKETIIHLKNTVKAKGCTKEVFEQFLESKKELGLKALLAITGFSTESFKRLITVIRIVDSREVNEFTLREHWDETGIAESEGNRDVWDAPTAPMGKSLQPSHYGILFYAKDGSKNKFYEIRYPHKRCRKCKYLLKDYGGKKAGLHPFGPLVSDVWTDIHRIKHNKYRDQHPCQLPIHLLERIILMTTDEGDIALDPFNGTGTTAVAAKRLGRKYVGFDIDEQYVKITEDHLAQEAPNSKLGDAWVSFYLNDIATIRDKDWEKLAGFYEIPSPIELIDKQKSALKRPK